MKRTHIFAAVSAACLVVGTAQAAPVADVFAYYDSFLENSVFQVTNDSTVAESISFDTSEGPTTHAGSFLVQAGQSFDYAFDAVDGGLEANPQSDGTPDTTTYSFTVDFLNGSPSLTSALFSPLLNATGGYVDFLGNTCTGFAVGCPVALSGTVATISAPSAVPEPLTASLLGSGLVMIAGLRRRRR